MDKTYENYGELSIDNDADDANVPVNVSIFQNQEDEEIKYNWLMTADNYMPRRGRVSDCAYKVGANTEQELVELVQKHIVPLYEAALHNLKTTGGNYYWEKR